MNTVASLPMYERGELNAAHYELWSHILKGFKARNLPAPKKIISGYEGTKVWMNTNLVLSQTCGLPFRTNLKGKVGYVGTPIYDLRNCPPGYYRSVFITNHFRKNLKPNDFIGSTFAINSYDSQSGYAAACEYFYDCNLPFSNIYVTGSHFKSALSVYQGLSDIACIDEISWKLIRNFDRFSSYLAEIAWTSPTPALPIITVKYRNSVDIVHEIMSNAIIDLSSHNAKTLLLKGFTWINPNAYFSIPTPKDFITK